MQTAHRPQLPYPTLRHWNGAKLTDWGRSISKNLLLVRRAVQQSRPAFAEVSAGRPQETVLAQSLFREPDTLLSCSPFYFLLLCALPAFRVVGAVVGGVSALIDLS